MAFPEDPLGGQVELQIGGVWTDVTGYSMKQDIITHSRGRKAEGQAVDPASCSLTLKSPNGLFSPRNPRSPYFGKIGRNTPMRVSVRAGLPALDLPGAVGDHASTPDTAALDIIGDIDIRVDATLANWITATDGTDTVELIGKMNFAAGNRSWVFGTRANKLRFDWSADGTNSLAADSTVDLPLTPSGRMAIRATLDVNNGASGRTITFYTSPTMAGPWTQLGSAVVQSGTTSIFNSPANLKIGDATDISYTRAVGRVHKAEVRAGIAGSIVANPDFTAQAVGATTFTDGAGRTWTTNGATSISTKRIRFSGEYSDWPSTWGKTGHLIKVEGEGAGILRRLNQGDKSLASTLRRRIPSDTQLLAYWPMEDGQDATYAASAIPGQRPLKTKAFNFAANDGPGGSSPLPEIAAGASFAASVPPPANGTGPWHVELVNLIPSGPVANTILYEIQASGTGVLYRVRVSATQVQLEVLDKEGTQLLLTSTTPGTNPSFFGTWNRVRVFARQNGSNVDVDLGWLNTVEAVGHFQSGSFAGTVGAVTNIRSSFGTGLDGTSFGHLAVFQANNTAIFNGADDGYNGETAGTRLDRLATEEGVPLTVAGVISEQERMGPQRPASLLEQLEQCEQADGGILTEDPARLGLRYRGRATQYNQSPALTLSYKTPGLGDLVPVPDDFLVRNDVEVARTGGSSAHAVREDGRLSVLAPPSGVSRYDDSVTLNLYSDDQAEPIAWWLVHLGTWDEARYPTITSRLHRATSLIPAILDLVEGDLIRITDLPDWLPPGPLDLLIQGWTERIGIRTWEIDLVCVPAGPYRVGVVADAVAGRVDANPGGSTLQAAAAATDTALVVHTPARGLMGPAPWITTSGASPTYPAEFPIAVQVAGEILSATAIRPWAYDVFGRSVAAGGWGTATDGQAWTLVSGSNSDRSVNGSRGAVTLVATPTTIRFQTLPGAVTDCEVRCRMSASAVATGAALTASVLLRYVDTSNYYRARLHFGLSGAMQVSVTRDVTQVGSAATLAYTYAATDEFEVRVRLTGHLVQVRVWPVGTLEPAEWHTEQTVVSSPIASGQVGLAAAAVTGNTNSSPQLLFDEFVVPTPQAWTVARAINGVSKAQAAGAEVRAERPAVLAL